MSGVNGWLESATGSIFFPPAEKKKKKPQLMNWEHANSFLDFPPKNQDLSHFCPLPPPSLVLVGE
jgi:hypothetical protein